MKYTQLWLLLLLLVVVVLLFLLEGRPCESLGDLLFVP